MPTTYRKTSGHFYQSSNIIIYLIINIFEDFGQFDQSSSISMSKKKRSYLMLTGFFDILIIEYAKIIQNLVEIVSKYLYSREKK